ncbi:hypothetical protein FQA39_LY02836 [Lamprigera yunnana]|nr:hypothetical protein FQA39_LY02836 [Lamprigera yunnana]
MSIADEVFTTALLEKVLENHLKTPSIVINVEIAEMLEPGENFCGKMLRIFVTYVIKNRGSYDVLSIIAKYPLIDNDATTLVVQELNVLERESRVYEEVLPKMREIGVKKNFGPKLYYNLSTPIMILFLEDLSAMGYEMKSRHEGLDLEHCLIALDKLAYFHGLSVVVHEKVDYQLSYFASPFVDIYYFLSTSINLQVKEKHMTTIFNYYIDKLILYLKELNVSERPSRNELLEDFKKRAFMGVLATCCATSLFRGPKRSDGNLNNFIKDNGPTSFRYACFNNHIYIKELEYLLPFYDSLGAFD